MSDPAPQPWQPPPAFTAAAAGMQVWRGPSGGPSPSWPAATGEPIGEPWPGQSPAPPGGAAPAVPGPATAAATQEAAARDAGRDGAAGKEPAAPGGTGHFATLGFTSSPPVPSGAPAGGQDATRPNGIAAEPRFFLPDPATGLIPLPGTPASPGAAPGSGDSGTQNFPLSEPTSDPLPRAGAAEPETRDLRRADDPAKGAAEHETGAYAWRPGGEPAGSPEAKPGPAEPAAQEKDPAAEWAVGSANVPTPAPTPWTPATAGRAGQSGGPSPWNTIVGLAADSGGEQPKQEQQRKPGSPNTDPLDIPVWPPPAAKAGEAAPATGENSPVDTTQPVPRPDAAQSGEGAGAPDASTGSPPTPAPPAPSGAGQAGQGPPTVANPMGHPQTPPSAGPGGQERPTAAAPLLAAPTPPGRPGFSPAPGGGKGPSTVAGPFVGFNAPASPAPGPGARPSAFTPAPPPPTEPPGFGPARPVGAPAPGAGGMGKKALVGAAIVVAIGAIGVGAYFAYQGIGDTPGPQAHGKVPSVVTPPQPEVTGPVEPIDSAQTDTKEMTPAEAFSGAKVTINGRTFRRVKVQATENCEQGAAGRFAEALKANQCARLLRATYVDAKRKYAVTTGIAVLPTKDAAVKVDAAKDLANNVWFRGLAGPARSGGERVEISGGYAAGLVWGRYIVFSYATYSDGHTPKAKEKDLAPISDEFRRHTSKVIEKRAQGG